MICADPKLSSADEEMAAAYKGALATPHYLTKAEMQSDQIAWLKLVLSNCKNATSLASAYRERIVFLRGIREGAAANPAVPMRLTDVVIDEERRYPQLRSEVFQPGAEIFNSQIRRIVGARQPGGKLYFRHETALVGRFIASYLYLSLDGGGVHPMPLRASVNVDVMGAKEIELADLFQPGAAYLPLLSQIARQKLLRQLEDGTWASDAETITRGTEPVAENFECFTLSSDGMMLHFAPYAVGPYSSGDAAVPVSSGELRSIRKPGGPLDHLGGK